MEPDYFLKKGDTEPAFFRELSDVDDSVVNLTGATARFLMRKRGESASVIDAEADIGADPTLGIVSYSWAEGDTDEPGDYDAEFEVTFDGGGVQTFPNADYLHIRILGDLSDEVSA